MRTELLLTLVTAAGLAAAQTPTIGRVANAASYERVWSVSPGEILVFFGGGWILGPDQLTLGQSGNKFGTSVAGTQVLFNGIAAPILYTSANQVSAIVPYEVAGMSTVDVQIQYKGFTFDGGYDIPVAPTALALFSADSTGTGPGAILNQDYSVNSPTHPAAPGEVIMLYGTGEGVSNPPAVDGKMDSVLHYAAAPISVWFPSWLRGDIKYAGGAPGEVPGLMQINVQVPPEMTACTEQRIPIWVASGSQTSQSGITLQIKTPPSICNSLPVPFTSGYMSPKIAEDDATGFGGTYTLAVSANGDGTYHAQMEDGRSMTPLNFINGIVKGSTLVFNQIEDVNAEPAFFSNLGHEVALHYGKLVLNLTLPMQPAESVSGSLTLKGVDLTANSLVTINADIPATTFTSGTN